MFIAIAVISNKRSQWEEEYEIAHNDTENARKYVKQIIDNFNNTLRSSELPRTLVKIKEIIQKGIDCKGCGQEIIFITSKTGRHIPCDPKPMSLVSLAGDIVQGYMPHWANCPEADRFKKK